MRRTSRLVLLLGIFLAAMTFVVVLFLGGGGGGGTTGNVPVPTAAQQLPTLEALADIPLGTVVTTDMLTPTPQRISAWHSPSASR